MQSFNLVIFGDKLPFIEAHIISEGNLGFFDSSWFSWFLLIFGIPRKSFIEVFSDFFGFLLILNWTPHKLYHFRVRPGTRQYQVETTDFRCGWISQKVGSGAKCRPHAVDLVGKPMGFEWFWVLRVLNFQTPLNFYGWIPGNVAQKHFKKHHLSNHPIWLPKIHHLPNIFKPSIFAFQIIAAIHFVAGRVGCSFAPLKPAWKFLLRSSTVAPHASFRILTWFFPHPQKRKICAIACKLPFGSLCVGDCHQPNTRCPKVYIPTI